MVVDQMATKMVHPAMEADKEVDMADKAAVTE